MTWWTIAIYGIAGVLALQGLFALMAAHRAAALRRIFNEMQRENEQSANVTPSDATRNAA